MIDLGIDAAKISVLRNGVDLATFAGTTHVGGRELGLDGTVLCRSAILCRRKARTRDPAPCRNFVRVSW